MRWIQLAVIAGVLALAAAGVAMLRAHWVGVGARGVQAAWDAQQTADRAAAAENAAELQRIARLDQTRKQEQADRIAHDQDQRLAALALSAGRTAARNRSLLGTIAALNGRVAELSRSGADAGACTVADAHAVTARNLLGQCSSRYAAMADRAGELASQVIGLQQYAQLCQGERTPELARER